MKTRWAYLLGFCYKAPYSIFVSEDPAVVERYAAHVATFAKPEIAPKIEILERW